jgi:hypothetical protein
MYSSLHKIDIVAEEASRKVFVQTDHRERHEVDAELEVSVIFALARTILPMRMEGSEGAVVRYVALGELHPAIAKVLVATGAELEEHGEKRGLSGIERSTPATLADEAFASLGKRLLAAAQLPADEAGLVAFAKTLSDTPALDEDEIAYWTNVVHLAAVTGEVIRAKYRGEWIEDTEGYADIPFVFRPEGDTGMVNPIGKAIKFFRHGEAEGPHHLLRALEDRDCSDGPLLLSIRPSSWGMRDAALGRPLLDRADKIPDTDVPFVAYGRDQPNTFAVMMKDRAPRKDGKREETIEELHPQALANLRKVEVEVEKVELPKLTFYVVHGSYFACEKVFDVVFMKALAMKLDTSLLAVGMPEKGRLFVINGVTPPEQMAGFLAIVAGVHNKNEGGRAISPTVFLVSDGLLAGVVTPRGDEPKPEKKGFFKRLFS